MRQNHSNSKVYIIRNSENDKVYVGSTTLSLSDRWHSHKTNTDRKASKLYTAMREIGVDKFTIELLEECKVKTGRALREREKHHILQHDSVVNGYNMYLPGRTPEERKEQKKLVDKAYRNFKGEELLAQKRQYYQNNKERIKANVKAYTEANQDKIRDYQKQYRDTNKEHLKAYMKKWRETQK